MRSKMLTIALAVVVLTTASLVATRKADACPSGYFQCGRVCCPGR
jgi:hypothetical protein